jgi:hypothetical protein
MIDNAAVNSPFAAQDFSNGIVRARLVSVGLRVRYVGSQLEMGGSVMGLVHPDRDSLSLYNSTKLLSYDRTIRKPVSRQWIELRAAGWDPDADFSYQNTGLPWGGFHSMGFLIHYSGQDPAFEFEYYANFEAIGSGVRDKTPSYSDAVGADTIIQNADSMKFQQGSKDEGQLYQSNPLLNLVSNLGVGAVGGFATEALRQFTIRRHMNPLGIA